MKLYIPDTDQPRVVIVGGGFGGLEIAKSLKKAPVQIVLLDRNNYHTFQPLLYQVATAALEADSIAFPIRNVFKGFKNFFFRMAEVERIDPKENTIYTNIGDLTYDYLVVATGADTNYFGMEGLILRSMPMKTIHEALDLRHLILQNFEQALSIENKRKKDSLMTFVVAGAGPTGVELAGALGELKQKVLPKDYPELDFKRMKIHLVQSPNRVLPALSQKSSDRAKRYLESLGVEVVLNTRVVDYFGDYVQTNTERDFKARTLIWTTGVRGVAVPGIGDDKVNRSGRIAVNEHCLIEGYDNEYAIGDVACMITEDYPRGHPMVAPVAMQQGALVAKNIMRKLKGEQELPFVYNNQGAMATVGKNRAVVELGKRTKWGGAWAWFVWMFVHLRSLIGFRNKFIVFFNWFRNYLNSDRGVRLILEKYDRSAAKKKRKKKFLADEEES